MKNYATILFAVLMSSMVLGQTTWYEIPTGTNKKLNAIDFPSSSIGYIVGEDSTLLKTTDGGQTWQQLGMNGIATAGLDDNFTDIKFIDESTGFLVAGYSGVFKTTDGAQNWTQVGSSMCFPHTVFPFDGTNYLVAGGDCFEGAKVDKVVNGTGSAANISTNFWNSNEIVLEMSFSGPNRGLAATRNPYILRTIDGGNNWDTISTGISGALTSVLMIDDTLCYAGYDENGGGFGILKSIDGGLSWQQDGNAATFFYPAFLSVHQADNGDIYSGAAPSNTPGGLIFETPDGIAWSYANVDQPIHDMTSYGSDITFGVGDSGYLVVNTPISSWGMEETTPFEWKIFPNPVVDLLTIENPKNQHLNVEVLDAYGRLVRTSKTQDSSLEIDFSELKSGTYMVLVTEGQKNGLTRIVKM